MDRQQVFSAMEPDINKSLDVFNSVAADLMNSTYILVSGKISRFLQTVAGSRPMYEYFMHVTAGYDFVEHFKSAQLLDETGRAFLQVPQNTEELLRFAFCLLYAIDTQRVNVERLLHTYYYDIDPNTELRGFLHAVVMPFVQCVNAVFAVAAKQSEKNVAPQSDLIVDWNENYSPDVAAANGQNDMGQYAPSPSEQQPEYAQQQYGGDFAEQTEYAPEQPQDYGYAAPEGQNYAFAPEEQNYAPASEGQNYAPAPEQSAQYGGEAAHTDDMQSLLSSLSEITCEIINVAANSPLLTTAGREELLIVADAFNSAVGFGDFKTMKMMFVSLKNTVHCSAIASELEDKINGIEYLMNGKESNA